jgi:hypothetical protein
MKTTRNRTKKQAARNGKAPGLAELFAQIAAPPAPGPAAGLVAGRAELLAALADGSLLTAGADSLNRLGDAIRRGWLDDADLVSDADRRRVIDFVSARLREGGPAEKIAAAGVWDAIMSRPGVRARPGDAEPSPSGSDGPAAASAPEGDGPAPPPKDRDRRGQFLRGNKASLGNASSRKMAQLRGAFLEDIDGPKLRQLAAKLFSMAMSGDLEATRLILFYALGKPRESPDADRLDLDEWRLLRASPTPAQVWFTVDQGCDPSFGVELWRRNSAATPADLFQQVRRETDFAPERFAKSQLKEHEAKIGR